MDINQLLQRTRHYILESGGYQPSAQSPAWVLFFSLTDMSHRAHVLTATGESFEAAWAKGATEAGRYCEQNNITRPVLRIDIVDSIEELSWKELNIKLSRTKRNYFRFGLSFDPQFTRALLEQELCASAILYEGDNGVATPNPGNLAGYTRHRFGEALQWPEDDETLIWRFKTRALFAQGNDIYPLENEGRNSGYRKIDDWQATALQPAIQQGSDYLAGQVKENGEYNYGWFPCFDRPVRSYNALRHASSTYALIESWEVTRSPAQLDAIERALEFLTVQLIRQQTLPSGGMAAFLIDVGDEIKLGGNAVSVLALAKYSEVTGSRRYLPLMEQLAAGISFMQHPDTGGFTHVLNARDLSVKNEFRIIYYDGEAAFALMRLYDLTRNPRWLAMVEHAFDYFIERRHWKSHDHWLSYCVNELTRYRPEEKYFRFGLDNVRDHLDFVLNRVTTYPTLLELMMAASRMIARIKQDPQHAALLDDFDCRKFEQALEYRARYLLSGFFWPEVAMFFKNPQRITGSFFIRHHSYRVRIDDVEHYLSGYVAYLKDYQQRAATPASDIPAENKPQQLLFLTGDMRNTGNGIEIASRRRAMLFSTMKGLTPSIVTAVFNPGLRENVRRLKDEGKLPENTEVLNIYYQLPGLLASGRIIPLRPLSGNLRVQEHVIAGENNPVARVRYHAETPEDDGGYEDYCDLAGNILLRKRYQRSERGEQLQHIQLAEAGDRILTFKDHPAFVTYILKNTLSKDVYWHFIIDKNQPYRDFVCSSPRESFSCSLTAVIHSTHKLPNGSNKQTYRHLLEKPDLTDRLIVLTHEQFNDLSHSGYPQEKIRVIPHHIDENSYPQHGEKIPSRTVIYLARYSPEKQHHLLLRVFRRVLESVPDAKLETYGMGPLRKQLVQECEQTGLTQSVSVNGFTGDISKVHQHAACAVLCSNQEGLSIFALECMAFGTPLVSFAIKYGPKDILADTGAGILVPEADEEAMAAALIKVLRDPELQLRMQTAARDNAKRFYNAPVTRLWDNWLTEISALSLPQLSPA